MLGKSIPGLFQSTPPSLAETIQQSSASGIKEISIHSAIASGDTQLLPEILNTYPFQSTPPSLAETIMGTGTVQSHRISIHSAIASGDF